MRSFRQSTWYTDVDILSVCGGGGGYFNEKAPVLAFVWVWWVFNIRWQNYVQVSSPCPVKSNTVTQEHSSRWSKELQLHHELLTASTLSHWKIQEAHDCVGILVLLHSNHSTCLGLGEMSWIHFRAWDTKSFFKEHHMWFIRQKPGSTHYPSTNLEQDKGC